MRALSIRTKYDMRAPIVAAAVMAGVACGQPGQETDHETGTVEGRVADDDGQNFTSELARVEGAIVTAYRIEADGSIETVSRESVAVGADGGYAIDVDMQAATGADLLIRAESESGGELVGHVAVSESFGGGARMTAPPIDAEATVVADLYLSARASGSLSGDVNPGMFWLTAGTDLAAELAGAGEAEIAAAAEAAAAAATAWRAAIVHESTGASEQDVSAALRFSAEAEADLSADLAAGDRDAALDAYAEAVLSAHADAGIESRYVARAAIASAEVMAAYAGELEGDARTSLRVSAETHKARVVTKALVARAERELSAAAASAMAEASATLRAEIAAAAAAGAEAEAAMVDAWASFQAEAEAEIAAALGVTEAQIETVVEGIEEAADTLASSFDDLSGSLGIGGSVELAISGMADFFAAAEAEAELLAELGLAAAEAEAAVGILAAIVACGS